MATLRRKIEDSLAEYRQNDWITGEEIQRIAGMLAAPDASEQLKAAGYIPYAAVANPPGGPLVWTVEVTARHRWSQARREAGIRPADPRWR